MQIKRINASDFSLWRDKIAELLYDSAKMNFPDYTISRHYGDERCDRVLSFIEDGTAVVFVASEQERLMGWAWCHPIIRLGKKRLHIAEIAVSDSYRNHGIGSRLLEKIEEYAIASNYEGLDLLVTANNNAAVGFYQKASFTTERYLMKKDMTKEGNRQKEN